MKLPRGVELVRFANDVGLIVVAPTAWGIELIANEALDRVGEWFTDHHLQLDEQDCEGLLVSKKRNYEVPAFRFNGHDISIKRNIKYLGM